VDLKYESQKKRNQASTKSDVFDCRVKFWNEETHDNKRGPKQGDQIGRVFALLGNYLLWAVVGKLHK
jgi:hypothetical protein